MLLNKHIKVKNKLISKFNLCFNLKIFYNRENLLRMLELEVEQCRASYQREYERTHERLARVEAENLELCKSIDENTIDDAMKQQIANVINENLVCFFFISLCICFQQNNLGTSSTNSIK